MRRSPCIMAEQGVDTGCRNKRGYLFKSGIAAGILRKGRNKRRSLVKSDIRQGLNGRSHRILLDQNWLSLDQSWLTEACIDPVHTDNAFVDRLTLAVWGHVWVVEDRVELTRSFNACLGTFSEKNLNSISSNQYKAVCTYRSTCIYFWSSCSFNTHRYIYTSIWGGGGKDNKRITVYTTVCSIFSPLCNKKKSVNLLDMLLNCCRSM